MKRKWKINLAALAVVVLTVGAVVFLNRQRALVRQPVLFIKCLVADQTIGRQPGRWAHVVATTDYFWNAYQVRIAGEGDWHCLPLFCPMEKANEAVDSNPEIEIEIDTGAQPSPGAYSSKAADGLTANVQE